MAVQDRKARRRFLKHAGVVALGMQAGTLQTVLGQGAMGVLRVCYKSGVKFDEMYYISKHMPLVNRVLKPLGLKRVEVMRIGKNADGSSPIYQTIFSGYFDSVAAMQAALGNPATAGVTGDVKNFYDGMPDILTGEIVPGVS